MILKILRQKKNCWNHTNSNPKFEYEHLYKVIRNADLGLNGGQRYDTLYSKSNNYYK